MKLNTNIALKSGDVLPIAHVWGSKSSLEKEISWELCFGNHTDSDLKSDGKLLQAHSPRTEWVFSEQATYTSYRFELAGSYPIRAVQVSKINDLSGNQDYTVTYSLDRKHWVDQVDELVRYVQITMKEDRSFSNRKLQVIVGQGIACEYDTKWTSALHRLHGWTGSDGIYSVPFSGGDVQGSGGSTDQTLFIFGDTFIGEVDPKSNARISQEMINNTFAILTGSNPLPEAWSFVWDDSDPATPKSSLVPSTANGLAIAGTYYWLQDGVNVAGNFYCFPMIIGPNPDGPDGFQFAAHGIARIRVPMGDGKLMFDKQDQIDTSLYYTNHKGHTTYYGAAIMSNTRYAHAPQPDGYIYIYGIQQTGMTDLVVARVTEQQFEHIDQWMYWDGHAWNQDPASASPIAQDVSCELSISLMIGGKYDGKYVITYMKGGVFGTSVVSLAIGDSPIGPFDEHIPLYYCDELEQGNGVYAYNAKAHPHLSEKSELLVSYNINTTSWDAHMQDGSIYRPRFLKVFEIK